MAAKFMLLMLVDLIRSRPQFKNNHKVDAWGAETSVPAVWRSSTGWDVVKKTGDPRVDPSVCASRLDPK